MSSPIYPLEYSVSHSTRKLSVVWEDPTTAKNPSLHLHEIDNIVIDKSSHPEFTREYSRSIGGPCFFVGVYESQFYHFVMDGIAQFLWLKSFIPDLRIFFINDQPSSVGSLDDIPIDFIRNLISWCREEDFGGEIIDISKYKKIKIDKLFCLANSNVTFLRQKLNIVVENLTGDVSNSNGARQLLLPRLKEFLYKKALEHNRLPADFNYPERVFLRPGLTIDRMQAWKAQVDFLVERGVVFDEEYTVVDDPTNALQEIESLHWKHKINTSTDFKGLMREISDRHLSAEEVEQIDAFFLRRDYEFVDSEKMAWVDILNIVINAKKVALLAGAASVNAMVAEEKTQIIYIDWNMSYEFNHRGLLDLFFTDPKPFYYYDRDVVHTKRYEISRILNDLEKEKGHYI